jgi:hypothetical protein
MTMDIEANDFSTTLLMCRTKGKWDTSDPHLRSDEWGLNDTLSGRDLSATSSIMIRTQSPRRVHFNANVCTPPPLSPGPGEVVSGGDFNVLR